MFFNTSLQPTNLAPRSRVQSSAVTAIGYLDLWATLDVAFQSGAVYRYFAVPRAVYDAFLQAPSKGLYLNQHIKGRFAYARLRPPRPSIP
jgi:hypothetical protein